MRASLTDFGRLVRKTKLAAINTQSFDPLTRPNITTNSNGYQSIPAGFCAGFASALIRNSNAILVWQA